MEAYGLVFFLIGVAGVINPRLGFAALIILGFQLRFHL